MPALPVIGETNWPIERTKRLEAAEEFVEFVGGVEIGFQFAGVQALADVIDALGQEVQGCAQDFAVG